MQIYTEVYSGKLLIWGKGTVPVSLNLGRINHEFTRIEKEPQMNTDSHRCLFVESLFMVLRHYVYALCGFLLIGCNEHNQVQVNTHEDLANAQIQAEISECQEQLKKAQELIREFEVIEAHQLLKTLQTRLREFDENPIQGILGEVQYELDRMLLYKAYVLHRNGYVENAHELASKHYATTIRMDGEYYAIQQAFLNIEERVADPYQSHSLLGESTKRELSEEQLCLLSHRVTSVQMIDMELSKALQELTKHSQQMPSFCYSSSIQKGIRFEPQNNISDHQDSFVNLNVENLQLRTIMSLVGSQANYSMPLSFGDSKALRISFDSWLSSSDDSLSNLTIRKPSRYTNFINKLNHINIPYVDFENKPLSQVLKELGTLSVENDKTTIDNNQKGTEFLLGYDPKTYDPLVNIQKRYQSIWMILRKIKEQVGGKYSVYQTPSRNGIHIYDIRKLELFNREEYVQKLHEIKLPQLDLESVPLIDVLDFLSKASIKYDNSSYQDRGVEFFPNFDFSATNPVVTCSFSQTDSGVSLMTVLQDILNQTNFQHEVAQIVGGSGKLVPVILISAKKDGRRYDPEHLSFVGGYRSKEAAMAAKFDECELQGDNLASSFKKLSEMSDSKGLRIYTNFDILNYAKNHNLDSKEDFRLTLRNISVWDALIVLREEFSRCINFVPTPQGILVFRTYSLFNSR